MKKAEIVDLMMKNKERFSYIKMAEKKAPVKKAPVKKAPVKKAPPAQKKKQKFKVNRPKPAPKKQKFKVKKPKTPPKAKTPTKAKTPPKSKTPSPPRRGKGTFQEKIFGAYPQQPSLSFKIYQEDINDFDLSYEKEVLPLLLEPALKPDRKLKTYNTKAFADGNYDIDLDEDDPAEVEKMRRDMIKRARKDNDGLKDRESFLNIAYDIKFSYEGFTDFIVDFKKNKPNYFKYFKEWFDTPSA